MPDGSLQERRVGSVGGVPSAADSVKVEAGQNQPARRRKLLVADLFCGAGGTSTGAERAFRRMGYDMVLACVNHWPVAVETHQLNHPTARHYCMDIEAARPEEIVPEGRLDLLLASPTCTYHSRARGGRPTSDQQRMDPWQVVRWVTTLRVKRLVVENVPEFVDWGPVDARTGKPIKSRKGEYFNAWLDALKAVGMRLDWRIVNCADYGDATTRKRFILLGRSDRQALHWAAPTHAPREKAAALGLKPWRAAREVIDWTDRGESIFTRARPLAPNTIRRIAAGVVKYCGDYAGAFLVVLRRHCDARDLELPLPTITANGTHLGICHASLKKAEAFVAGCGGRAGQSPATPVSRPLGTITAKNDRGLVNPFVFANRTNNVAQDIDGPVPTIVTSGNLWLTQPQITPFVLGQQSGAVARAVDHPAPTISTGGAISLTQPLIMQIDNSGGGDQRIWPASRPLPTVVTKANLAVVEPFVATVNHADGDPKRVRTVDVPMATIATKRGEAVVSPFIARVNHGDSGGRRVFSVDDPLLTVTGSKGEGIVEPFITNLKGRSTVRAGSEPLPTITAAVPHLSAVQPFVTPYYGSGSGLTGKSVDVPLDTITVKARLGVAQPFVVPHFGEAPGQVPRTRNIERPMATITGQGAGSLVEPFIVPQFSTGAPKGTDEPLGTITTTSRGVGLCDGLVDPVGALAEDYRNIAPDDPRIVVVDGVPMVFDLTFRMLKNPELARATSFSNAEYEYEFVGNQSEVTKQIGNAVPVETAMALIGGLFEPVQAKGMRL